MFGEKGKLSVNRKLILLFSVLVSVFTSEVHASKYVPQPKSWSYPEVNEYAREIAPKNIEGKPFNQFGSVYSYEDMKRIKLSSASASELQKYAGMVYHAFPDASARRFPNSCENLPKNLSVSYVVGIAYISINAIEESNRAWAATCLGKIQENQKRPDMATSMNVAQLERVLEKIVLCREHRATLLINSRHLLSSHFEKQKSWYEPKNKLSVFGGKVLRYFPDTAGMSPGATVVVELDFDTAKNRVQNALGVIFDRCENKNNMNMKYCSKKLSTKNTIGILRNKESKDGQWVSAIMCSQPYEK